MKNLVAKYPIATASVSGVLAGGVYSFGFPSLLLPFILALFFNTLLLKTRQPALKNFMLRAAAFFWSFYFVVLIWFLNTDVALLAGLSGDHARLLLGLCLVIMVTMWTAVTLPFMLIFFNLRTKLRTPTLLPALTFAGTWAVMEWTRSLAFSVFLYAPGASMGDYWNFGSLGLGLIGSPLGYLTQFIGMYGLGMVVVLAALTMVWAFNKRVKPLIVLVACMVVLAIGGYVLNSRSSNESKVSASVLQREGKLDDLSSGYTDYKFLQQTPKELIVLTEYSRIHAQGNEKYAQKYVFDRLSENGISIDVLADFTKPGIRYNTLEGRNKNGELLDTQTKQLLIPTGEYLPGLVQLFYKFTGQDSLNQNYASTRQLYRGQPPRVITNGNLTVAPVACSGILGRNIYRDLVNDGGQVLTNSASLLIFSGSQAYFRQSLQMARFHAVASQRTYIQASMGAPAFVMDDNGEFIIAPEDTRTAFIDFEFTPRNTQTVYTKFGEWPLMLAALVTAGFVLKLVLTRARSRLKH